MGTHIPRELENKFWEASVLWRDDTLFCQSLSTYRFTDSTFKRVAYILQDFQKTELPACGILVYKDVFVALTSTYGLALVVVAATATRAGAPATLAIWLSIYGSMLLSLSSTASYTHTHMHDTEL